MLEVSIKSEKGFSKTSEQVFALGVHMSSSGLTSFNVFHDAGKSLEQKKPASLISLFPVAWQKAVTEPPHSYTFKT